MAIFQGYKGSTMGTFLPPGFMDAATQPGRAYAQAMSTAGASIGQGLEGLLKSWGQEKKLRKSYGTILESMGVEHDENAGSAALGALLQGEKIKQAQENLEKDRLLKKIISNERSEVDRFRTMTQAQTAKDALKSREEIERNELAFNKEVFKSKEAALKRNEALEKTQRDADNLARQRGLDIRELEVSERLRLQEEASKGHIEYLFSKNYRFVEGSKHTVGDKVWIVMRKEGEPDELVEIQDLSGGGMNPYTNLLPGGGDQPKKDPGAAVRQTITITPTARSRHGDALRSIGLPPVF